MKGNIFPALSVLLVFPALTVRAQLPAPAPAAEPAKTVAATVNGKSILESEIQESFEGFWNVRTRGRPMPPGTKEQMFQQMRPQVLDVLINDILLDEQAAALQITVADQQFLDEIKASLRIHLIQTGGTEEEFQKQLSNGSTVEQFLQDRSQDPAFRRSVVQEKLLEKRYPAELAVSPDEIAERYKRDLNEVYTKPPQVRASHILLGIRPDATAEDRAAAHAKASQLVDQARAPGADFAVLASQNSSCPSKDQGGDLGFFPREGKMVEPFAAAAFALKVGEVSDVVETQFGYHIIKATGQKELVVVTLEQATEVITSEIEQEKLAKVRELLTAELREKAQITYPG